MNTIDPQQEVEDFAESFAGLLPRGAAWPRDPESVLMRLVLGLSENWATTVQGRARDLLYVESTPDTTTEMLEDWERALGLPEECYDEVPQTVEARRAIVIEKLTTIGAQSREYFIGIAQRLGHPDARISEFSPFRCGVSRCGSTQWRVGPPDERYVWRMYVGPSAKSWFQAGKSRCGQDPQMRIRRSAAVECIINKLKPEHTRVIFLYSFPTPGYPIDVEWFRAGKSRAGRDPQARVMAWGEYVEPSPQEITYFRAGRNRAGRDPQAHKVTVVVR